MDTPDGEITVKKDFASLVDRDLLLKGKKNAPWLRSKSSFFWWVAFLQGPTEKHTRSGLFLNWKQLKINSVYSKFEPDGGNVLAVNWAGKVHVRW